MMEKIQAWIEKHLVPVINKITSNFWFGIVADAVLFIVPFSMVSAIPSLWAILRRFVPVLPDISPLSTFSFGLIGLFVVFVIPYNCLQKIEKKDRSMIAGFTGIGAYMMCMNFQTVDGGSLVSMNKFGAGGMFTAMVVGLMVAVIYKLLAKYSFFGEDSVIPDFVKNWFDNIAAILISLTIAYLFTYIAKIDPHEAGYQFCTERTWRHYDRVPAECVLLLRCLRLGVYPCYPQHYAGCYC